MARAYYTVELGIGGLNTLFKLSEIDKKKVAVKALHRKKGWTFTLEGTDADRFENVISGTSVPYTVDLR